MGVIQTTNWIPTVDKIEGQKTVPMIPHVSLLIATSIFV